MKKFNINKNGLHRDNNKKIKSKINDYTLLDHSHKVISYSEYKRSNRIKYFKNHKLLILILITSSVVYLISLSSSFFSTKKTVSNNSAYPSFISTEPELSKSEFISYSDTITSAINGFVGTQYNCVVKTDNIHRNGTSIYAQGYFYFPNKDNIYFDILLKNKDVKSLVINGVEYIK